MRKQALQHTSNILNIFLLMFSSYVLYSMLNSEVRVLDSLLTSVSKFYRNILKYLKRPDDNRIILEYSGYRMTTAVKCSNFLDIRCLQTQCSYWFKKCVFFCSPSLECFVIAILTINCLKPVFRWTNEQLSMCESK